MYLTTISDLRNYLDQVSGSTGFETDDMSHEQGLDAVVAHFSEHWEPGMTIDKFNEAIDGMDIWGPLP